MGAKLVSFLFNSFRKRANDPANKTFWMPKALQGADKPGGSGKLLPLQGQNWDLGQITGETGAIFADTIEGQWWLLQGRAHKGDPQVAMHQPAACPAEPWPRLGMPSVTVFGLDNLWLQDNPVLTESGTGYTGVITLQFGHYGDAYGLSQLRVEGEYTLEQCVCAATADDPPVFDDWIPSEQIRGKGTFAMSLSDVYVDATVDVQVAGTGAGRALSVTIPAITLRGPDGATPGLTVDELTVKTIWEWMSDNIWLPQAAMALESDDGREALFANINATLNDPASRRQLADMLTQQLAHTLDDALGAVPAGTLPAQTAAAGVNPADQYLFDRLRVALNNPASDYYLPKVICRNSEPRLEPYKIAKIALGSQTVSGITLQNIQLTGITVTGLSNLVAPVAQLTLTESGLTGTLQAATLNPGPKLTLGAATVQVPSPPMTATGQFSLNIAGDSTVLTGAYTLKVTGAKVAAAISFGGDEVADLTISFKQLSLSADSSGLAVTVAIKSAFTDFINQVLNQDAVKQSAIKGINDQLTRDLSQIGASVTAAARQLLAARLDG